MKSKFIPTLMLLVTGVVARTYAQNSATIAVADQKPLQPMLEQVIMLTPVTYTYDPQTVQLLQLPKQQQIGFISDDVKKVLPELLIKRDQLVPAGKNAMKSISYETVDMTKLVPILVKAIQEQQKQIDELKRGPVPAAVQPIPQNFKDSYMEAEGCIFFDPWQND